MLTAIRTARTASIYIYKAKMIQVVDGDTIDLEIDLGFKMRWATTCRFVGIDVYERNEKHGQIAKRYVADLFSVYGPEFFLHSDRDQIAIYNRVAGRPYLEHADGFVDVIGSLLASGFAKGKTPLPVGPVILPTRDIVAACALGMKKRVPSNLGGH